MIFKHIVIMSLSGSLFYLSIKMLKILLKDVIDSNQEYILSIAVNLMYVLPLHLVNINLSGIHSVEHALSFVNVLNYNHVSVSPEGYGAITIYQILSYIWAIGMGIYFICIFAKFYYVQIKLNKMNEPLRDKNIIRMVEMTSNKVGLKSVPQVFINAHGSSPFVMGLLKPSLVLNNLNDASMELVVEHELVHIKRKDLLFRYICLISCGIFWFCPLIFFLKKELLISCELSCDKKVLNQTSVSEKVMYFRSVLYYSQNKNIEQSRFCNFAKQEKKSILQRRVDNMFRKSKKTNLFKCAIVATCITILTVGVILIVSTVNSSISIRENNIEADSSSGTYIPKMITQNYTSESSIPTSVPYSEYIDGEWWGGLLEYDSYKYLSASKLYQATFSGTMERH